jgi:hypothetical protein
MVRILLEGFGLFLTPFLVFALWLAAKGQNPMRPEVWSRQALSNLTLIAIAVCIAGLVVLGITRDARQGGYTPPYVGKDGQIVPGQFR